MWEDHPKINRTALIILYVSYYSALGIVILFYGAIFILTHSLSILIVPLLIAAIGIIVFLFTRNSKPVRIYPNGIEFSLFLSRKLIPFNDIVKLQVGPAKHIYKFASLYSKIISPILFLGILSDKFSLYSNTIDPNAGNASIVQIKTAAKTYAPGITDISGMIAYLESLNIKLIKKENIFIYENITPEKNIT